MKKLLILPILFVCLLGMGQSSNYFNSSEHVYIKGLNYSENPVYINGYAKIGRLPKKGEVVDFTYRFGYIDSEGRIIISPDYLILGDFSEGLVSVCNETANGSFKLGFMNVTGKIVIPLIYECGFDVQFSEGLCHVKNAKGKYGFINQLGKVVIPFLYGRVGVEGFENGIARVAKTDFLTDPFTINKQGKMVSEESNAKINAETFINGTDKTASNVGRGIDVTKSTSSNEESYISKMAKGYAELLKIAKDNGVSIEKTKYGDVSTNNYSVKTNAWQCNKCGKLSRNPKEPSGGEFGRCNNDFLEHSWSEANTNSGFQCTYCGIISHVLNRGRSSSEPCCGEFGRCVKRNYPEHNWRKF